MKLAELFSSAGDIYIDWYVFWGMIDIASRFFYNHVIFLRTYLLF